MACGTANAPIMRDKTRALARTARLSTNHSQRRDLGQPEIIMNRYSRARSLFSALRGLFPGTRPHWTMISDVVCAPWR